MTYLTGWKLATSPIARKRRHQFINLDIFFKGLERFKFFPSFNNSVYNEKYYPSLWLHFALTTQTLFFHWGNILPYWSSIWGLCVPWVYEGFGTRNVHCCSNKRNKMYLFITTINTAVKWTIKINDMKISVTNVSAVIEK